MAIGAALLFGASTPLSRALLAHVSPVMLAALLYLGAGLGLGLSWLVRRGAPLARADLPWLAGASLFGGVLGPIALLFGLRATPAGPASLLLNLESVFTALLAWALFREAIDRRLAAAMALVFAGSLALAWPSDAAATARSITDARWFGPPLVALACALWAIDNNLTRKISDADVRAVVALKCLVAGAVNLAVALATGARWPEKSLIVRALSLGFASYGLSLLLFVLALRHLGAARTGSWFSLAPFVGALGAVLYLHEPITAAFALASLLMGAGLALHAIEKHEHEHEHDEETHEHGHHHDDGHHEHSHEPNVIVSEGHSHRHTHRRIVHKHRHFPDTHHRHAHDAHDGHAHE
ncbi:MAG: DMT family transporter [Polyangiales bacterium]